MIKEIGRESEVAKWLEAEGRLLSTPQPPDTITADQYAQLTKRSRRQANDVLNRLVMAGEAEKFEWLDHSRRRNVYRLKKNESKAAEDSR